MQDLYEILGVEKNADAAAIKEAYRQKAKKLHPDAGGNRADFEELSKAHETLSDPAKRAKYDETGEADYSASVNTDAQQAIAFVSELVIGVINDRSINLVSDDVQEILTKLVVTAIHELEEVVNEGKSRVLRAAEFRKRMTRVDDAKGDPIALAIDLFESQAAAKIESFENTIRIRKIALEILEKYGYDFVRKLQPPAWPNIQKRGAFFGGFPS